MSCCRAALSLCWRWRRWSRPLDAWLPDRNSPMNPIVSLFFFYQKTWKFDLIFKNSICCDDFNLSSISLFQIHISLYNTKVSRFCNSIIRKWKLRNASSHFIIEYKTCIDDWKSNISRHSPYKTGAQMTDSSSKESHIFAFINPLAVEKVARSKYTYTKKELLMKAR